MKKTLVLAIVAGMLLARTVQVQSVTVDNSSFELPGTVKQYNWENVPNWSSDWVADASGVEENGYVGAWNGYVMAGTNPGNPNPDPSVWQLTGYTAAAGDVLDLAVIARIGWMSTENGGAVLGNTADFRMTLYYDNGGTRVVAKTQDVVMTTNFDTGYNGLRSEWIDYPLQLDVDAECPDAIGHDIGIEFYGVSYTGSNGCWIAMDDVRLISSSDLPVFYYVGQSSAGIGDGSSYENRMSVADHNDVGSFSPGDTIYLVDTITSRVKIPNSGTSGNEITYRGDYVGHPGVLTAYTSYGTIRGTGKDYLIIDGLEVKNGRIAIAFLNGCDYITIKNCLIHDMTGAGSKGIHFSSNTNPITRNSNVVIGGAEGEGNEVYNVGVDTGGVDIGLAHVDDFIVSYNKCYGGEPDTGIDGVTTNHSDVGIIEYNELYDHIKAWEVENPDMGEDGIDLKGCDNIHVRYNHIYGNRAGGIGVNNSDAMKANCSDIYIYNNLIYDNRANIVIGNLDQNAYVYNNIIYGSKKSHGISAFTDGENIHIYNNTFFNNHSTVNDGSKYELLVANGSNYYIKNNIFYSSAQERLVYHGNTTNANFDNNRYYYTGGAARIRWNGAYISFAELQALGQEANGTEGDPGLNDIGNNDYTLASNSACINTGADLDADYAWALDPTYTDFTTFPPSVYTLNQNNYGSGWEIGAYVFTGIACLPIDQTNWSVEFVDSEELVEDGGYPAENSFDSDPDTFWSTQWNPTSPPHPHEIQIDLGGFYDICGFRYLPRQDDGPGDENGMIKDYEFYVSGDSGNWGTAVASGTWTAGKTEKQVSFDHTLGQYVRLVALSEVNGNPWTTMAELNVLAVQPDTDINDDGKVDLEDFAVLATWWDDENACSLPDWCEGTDFDMSGTIDMLDLAYFVENWLRQAD